MRPPGLTARSLPLVQVGPLGGQPQRPGGVNSSDSRPSDAEPNHVEPLDTRGRSLNPVPCCCWTWLSKRLQTVAGSECPIQYGCSWTTTWDLSWSGV